MGAAMALTRDVELLASVVAHIRGSATGTSHSSIVDPLSDLAHRVLPQLDELTPDQRQTIAGVLTSIFRQAADLIEHPERPPGWTFDDPVVLQATGRASMSVASVLAQVAPSLDGLTSSLAAGGSFCDVGTGTAWLAIAAARCWPTARVMGIDIHPLALRLAEKNIADEGLDDRVTVQCLDVCDLDGQHDLIWLPGPFLPAAVMPSALAAVRRSLRANGWLALGVYGGPPDPIAQQLADLRTVRSGGHPWTAADAVEAVASAGYAQAREIDRTWNAPVRLIVGQRP
jgi:predicted RNA methylase